MDYLTVKHFHMLCAASSGGLFILRGIWMLRDSSLLQARWSKIAPHLIDTLLLSSALVMVIWSHQYPFVQPWLNAKLLALGGYILLENITLKHGKTKSVRVGAFISALLVFTYIGAVAMTKQVLVLT